MNDIIRPDTNEFLSGVVEGFYGRPWTHPQRRELFRRMQVLGLNSYLYAPKDDLKHRNHWRVPYSEEEETSLRELISASKEHNVLFIFAISPGLDMVFSSPEDELKLKNKLCQVKSLGCTAFALLFDDIETRLCPQDFQMFKTAANAQATITNSIYEHLNKPHIFMFCPTEYCETRAVPTVPNSDYLKTLGSKLISEIIVMWTGPLVISKTIPSLSIRDLNRLLRREVAIWDNLHANDYDQRRLFLGPYSGRPLALKRRKLLRGILINPNCEFEANYVAMHTLAQWTRHADSNHSKLISCEIDMRDLSDDEMFKQSVEINQALISEAESKNKDYTRLILLPTYSPREALINSLKDWLALMYKEHLIDQNKLDKVSEPMDTDSTNSSKPSVEMQVEGLENLDIELSDLEIFADFFYLPFEHGPSALRLLELGFWLRENAYYANGSSGPLFQESLVNNSVSSEWKKKYLEYERLVNCIGKLRNRFIRLPCKGVIFDMLPYINDIYLVLLMTNDFLRWLDSGAMALKSYAHLRSLINWYSQGYLEMVTSGHHEPWKFRGGIVTELHRILPLDSSQELFPAFNRAAPNMIVQGGVILSTGNNLTLQPEPMHVHFSVDVTYIVRPYTPNDRSQTFDLCQRKLLARLKIKDSFPEELRDLAGDRYLAGYLEHSPHHCFVIERLSQQRQVVGYALAAPEVVAWARDLHSNCLVKFWNQYRMHLPKEKVKPKELEIVNSEGKPTNLTLDEVIQRLIRWFDKTPEPAQNPAEEEGVASSLVEMAIITPPPDPLGASVPDKELASTVTGLQPETETSINPVQMDTSTDADLQKQQEDPNGSDLTLISPGDLDSLDKRIEKNVISTGNCQPEAIYAALAAHPASLVMEIDDSITEPNELEDVTQRLLICLLSSLKMVAVQGVHTELDDLNETRVDFFRHFGFYPVPITSFEKSTILARMI